MISEIREEAARFLEAWFETRRIVQTLNFNRFQQEGLSATQFIMLTMLGDGGPDLTASALSRRLNVNVTTTMRTADSLAARGLVLKAKDPENRRRTMLVLTDAGRTVHARMHEAFVGQVTAAFGAISHDLRAGLVDGLEAFVAAAATPYRSAGAESLPQQREDETQRGSAPSPSSPKRKATRASER